ncbi:MAG: TVP38/TMEM64 family protein [Candidatus Woesearchaeota archaeon]
MKYFRRIILWLIFAIIFLILLLSPLKNFLSEEKIYYFINLFGVFAPLIFIIFYIITSLLFFPVSLLNVFSGFLFGTLLGFVLVIISSTISASIAFFVAKKYGKNLSDWFKNTKKINKIVNKLDNLAEHNSFKTFFVIRCFGLSYILVSYASGLVRKASFKAFILATLTSNILVSIFLVYLGDNIHSSFRELLFPLLLLLIFIILPRIIVIKFDIGKKGFKLTEKMDDLM